MFSADATFVRSRALTGVVSMLTLLMLTLVISLALIGVGIHMPTTTG